ncbi:MAG: 2-hydroxychromene-2-carboxylate isomerase [Defluviimonas sp.]|uniref:2-hydroxychromene-2-carboxylate isomerase n=1 Tax=Albidovulum sp. TaxID=1872424 RepID=UPI001DFF5D3D|nr:2-hydroxychromene-2-carboxylate isomerase [Paracoccaceae bacterium]MCC0063341.1 2-hydroxychromene-2-carboxylate isomerase [Defluviimonas sp.]
MAGIDYFFSLLSPFTYLAGTRLEEIAARHGASIRYKPFDILAMYDRLGAPRPADRPQGRKDYRLQELRRIGKKTGMTINLQPAFWPTNPAPASYAVIAAQKAGGGDLGALVHGLLRACWAEEKDIAEDAVINDCLKAAGFDPALSFTGLLSGAEAYAANLEEAHTRGVFGAPFYITDSDERFWGQDRLDDLDLFLAGKL